MKLKLNNKVLSVCFNDAKEFVKNKLKDYLDERGISLQSMVAYMHQQNGKVEQYIWTLEDTVQMLMAEAGLPIFSLSDVVFTAQYLRNCIPTSILLDLVTLYKIIKGHKPDLSYFKVWSCQYFVLFLKKTCQKGYIRCFEAIFVSYEEG